MIGLERHSTVSNGPASSPSWRRPIRYRRSKPTIGALDEAARWAFWLSLSHLLAGEPAHGVERVS
ncbi:hypothetical protein LMTR13_12740 [Bradyrhizobium icense]|uniref:Uncharacterized protein n=1 Tax=Bradyrhizobium icense TaxID=1274631 RepID=A0A1B1UDQ8_9BRAD|nr:hypothetical protein LMTR13_12740 [Bradyrhizobium icense]